MSCKTILVYLNDTARAERLLGVATAHAKTHNAHLVGLAVIPPYVSPVATEAGMAYPAFDDHRIAYAHVVTKLEKLFTDTCRQNDLSCEWRTADAQFGTAAAQVIAHARSADLAVISQDNPDWSYTGFLEDAARVVMESGRPVLLVPNKGLHAMVANRALIAWNSRREAVRAAFDAIQLLPHGSDVTVLSIDTSSNPVVAGEIPGVDLCTALARHGFKCEAANVHAPRGDAAEAILQEATARGAELIVMGAYGHTRMREFFLGGATRDILVRMDRPVLMAH